MQSPRFLRRKAVLDRAGGISATLLFNLEKAGDFPRHFMLSPRCAVWLESEVDEWLSARAAAGVPPVKCPDRKATLPTKQGITR